jgi:hypothetical protein
VFTGCKILLAWRDILGGPRMWAVGVWASTTDDAGGAGAQAQGQQGGRGGAGGTGYC